ncbi:multiple inositol polyphosphate phosphatase 1-like [Amyelois transitella]|uniref:multiple inositol polyphosphate phosphatase 1-like n=1 Tax=Amyelois transitella TaxID=680683 RepID=UPI00298F8801|nr:multiple inositol polyphosphate phosphatase 1-like [Amyelois transitella]
MEGVISGIQQNWKANCDAISIWGLFRHGQRNPGIKYSENIEHVIDIRKDLIKRHKEGKGSLCVQDVENLADWKVNPRMFTDLHDTTEEGLYEMHGIAKRLKEAYKNLIGDLQPETYTFRSSFQPYIRLCIDSFLEGLGQPDLKVDEIRRRDIMSAFDDCKRYKKFVKHNQTTFSLAYQYQTTAEYLKSKENVQKRIGINYELTNEEFISLYDLCRYTWSAVDDKPSPWCALFDEEDLKIQEYYEDLRLYYRNGYGNPWNIEFGRIPLADLLKTFQLEKEKPRKKITAYFSHATMLSMTYSALGLFKDDKPLTPYNRDDHRKWRTSEHALFGGSLIAVLNKCNKKAPDDFVVEFYMNEKPLEELCNHGICTWDEFQEMLRPSKNKTFENVCYMKM